MDIREFGDALIRSGDLDPVYIGLYDAKLPEPQLCRLLLAYLCFYHLGVSAWLSEWEEDNYWDWMDTAATNQVAPPVMGGTCNWPRGTERRHFRGLKCVHSVTWLRNHMFAPEAAIRQLAQLTTEKQIMAKVGEWPMFGPWVGFKAADLMERVYGSKVSFDPDIGLMYDSPKVSLDLLTVDSGLITADRSPAAIYHNLMAYFSARKAPPRYDRYCNAQEVETILCKHGSMRSGHYHVGKDIHEVREALQGWGETAARVLGAMPAEVSE